VANFDGNSRNVFWCNSVLRPIFPVRSSLAWVSSANSSGEAVLIAARVVDAQRTPSTIVPRRLWLCTETLNVKNEDARMTCVSSSRFSTSEFRVNDRQSITLSSFNNMQVWFSSYAFDFLQNEAGALLAPLKRFPQLVWPGPERVHLVSSNGRLAAGATLPLDSTTDHPFICVNNVLRSVRIRTATKFWRQSYLSQDQARSDRLFVLD
jgi:hypothetical protein